MLSRVPDLSRMGLRQKRHAIIVMLALAGSLLYSELTAQAKSDYEIINTGIKGGGCWYDDSHFIVVKGQQPAPGQEFEVEGLYALDPNHPKDLKRLNLEPIEPSLQRHIRDVTCQDQTILFHILTPDKKRNTIYSLNIGRPPTVVVAKQEGFILPQSVNVRERYVLGVTNTISEPHSPNAEQAVKDCNFANLIEGYRVFCLRHDRGTKRTWPADNAFLTKYLWDETIRVTNNGQHQWVPNPEPPLKLPDGTEIKQGYLLRDLEDRIVREIPTKQGMYRIDELKPALHGTYLYATCSKAGDYDPPKTFYGRVCRLKLGEAVEQWEEVFHVQKQPNERASLYNLDVNDLGDVVVLRRAYHASPTMWTYSERDRAVMELRIPRLDQQVGGLQLAPDGRMISYHEKGHLTFVRIPGGTQ